LSCHQQTQVAAQAPSSGEEERKLRGLIVRLKQDDSPKPQREDAPAFIDTLKLLPDIARTKLFDLGMKRITSVGSQGSYKVEINTDGDILGRLLGSVAEVLLPTVKEAMDALGEY
jgi:hypothetical protein